MKKFFRFFKIIRKFQKMSKVYTLEVLDGTYVSFDPSEFVFAGFDDSGENIILVLKGRVPLFLPATLLNLGFLNLMLPAVQKRATANFKKIEEKIHGAAAVNDLTGTAKPLKTR